MRTKINTLLALVPIVLTGLLSCNKISESIQRDIFTAPTGVSFTIPKIPTTEEATVLGDLNIKNLNLDSLIKLVSPKFGVKNIKSIRMKEFKLELLDSDSLNNIQNIENITVKIKAAEATTQSIASVSPPNIRAKEIIIPITSGNSDFKTIITSPSFSYSLTVQLRTATTKELKAKATAIYAITVGL